MEINMNYSHYIIAAGARFVKLQRPTFAVRRSHFMTIAEKRLLR